MSSVMIFLSLSFLYIDPSSFNEITDANFSGSRFQIFVLILTHNCHATLYGYLELPGSYLLKYCLIVSVG